MHKLILGICFYFICIQDTTAQVLNASANADTKQNNADLTALADPTIDTKQPRIDFFASASVPFGMVALHPDTHQGNGLWNSGYRYEDKRILFFVHSHMVQTPGIACMPVVGKCKGNLGIEANSSAFSHSNEVIRPGYHKVKLEESGITAEMTATTRVGMHRETFPACDEAHILFPLSARLADVSVSEAFAKKISDTRIGGYAVLNPTGRRKQTCVIYFVAEFQKPFDNFAGWQGTQLVEAIDGQIRGKDAGAYVTFRHLKANEQLRYKVAISYVSIEGAIKNLEAELPGWDFDAVAQRAKQQWNDYLGRIKVSGGTKAQQIKHYTDLMHTAIGRRIYSDVDGSYMDRGGATPVVRHIPLNGHGQPKWNAIDMDCLWGTQWNLNILWTLMYPDYGNQVAQTLVEYYKNNGILGRGQWGGQENFTMTGDCSTPLLAALANNGRAQFDLSTAYAGARKNAFPGGVRDHAGYDSIGTGGGCDWYVKLGYVPVEIEKRGDGMHRGGSGMTLEYAYQDWCLAQLGRQLAKNEDAKLFTLRSENWRNVFDSAVGWARPRHENGNWVTPFAPIDLKKKGEPRGFIEASPATFSFYVPQNLPGLINIMGGKEAFVKRLDTCFRETEKYRFICPGDWQFSYVDYSNQPGCHMAHLFNYAGAPWLSQYWVRKVKELTFGGTDYKSGYNGDEDEGQMGALGVLMGIGLFSVQGCVGENPQLELTSPLFDHISLQLPYGEGFKKYKTFNIKVIRQDQEKDIYIQSVKLNGKTLNSFQLPVHQILQGGNMEIQLGPEPNKNWGITKAGS
ncbi:GH92 family glycosyl hydrolase [Chitinophaga eiseniae]|uniref:Glycoside hydrolase family 92 protein n=1 Tax=Chitinophaga eiseniae TaxID=634771 RepID=A0A847S9E7_9BACT|nr:GH92 family glycosyl hydrolase [Chitinophaga eiseniae]NLR78421.1 glycoside hydrolase family 92 protein [Chitinophaga eiseniae]